MTSTDYGRSEGNRGWEHIGRAAEDFARRVARDATKFAERMEEHATDFARDAARDWRRARRGMRHGCRYTWRASEPDVRRVFEEVRAVLGDVLDGVDELIERIFGEPADAATGTAPGETSADDNWIRIILNRDATCGGCNRAINAGDEGYVLRTDAGMEVRCLECGAPPAS